MTDLLFARSQMAVSLAFHIVFAAIGVAMPVLMVIAEIAWRRTGDRDYLALARAWGKGTAVLFAVGAVSGTVLSFELGLLFPGFMRYAGPIIGIPFSLEGFAFFLEAIFLGLYLYGWGRLRPRVHIAAGLVVALSGLASAAFVLTVNAWMNAPRGFRVAGGRLVDIDPIAALHSPFVVHEILHMVVAAYMATAFAVAGIHAFILLKNRRLGFHRKALGIALAVAIPFTIAQPFIGDMAARQVAAYQPLKLAAMEGQFRTEAHAPLRIGGFPDDEAAVTRDAIEIPGGLSLLAKGDSSAVVTGLDAFPRADWPPPIVHYAFQVMVGCGTALALLAVWAALAWLVRRRLPDGRALLRALVVAAPLGFVGIETGWIVTEVGRQPWVIYGVLRTAKAVTPAHDVSVTFFLFALVYLGLAAATTVILWRQVRRSPGAAGKDAG